MNVNIWILIQISQISQMRIFKCDSVDCFNFVTVDWCYIFYDCSFLSSQKFPKFEFQPKILSIFGPKIIKNNLENDFWLWILKIHELYFIQCYD